MPWFKAPRCPSWDSRYNSCSEKVFKNAKCWGETEDEVRQKVMHHLERCSPYHDDLPENVYREMVSKCPVQLWEWEGQEMKSPVPVPPAAWRRQDRAGPDERRRSRSRPPKRRPVSSSSSSSDEELRPSAAVVAALDDGIKAVGKAVQVFKNGVEAFSEVQEKLTHARKTLTEWRPTRKSRISGPIRK